MQRTDLPVLVSDDGFVTGPLALKYALAFKR